jgi:hypothetical protein
MNATEYLEFLTARTIPYKFPNGVPIETVRKGSRSNTEWDFKTLENVLANLQNYSHIERGDDMRIRASPRQLIRTTSGELILVGARGQSLIEKLKDLHDGEVTIELENSSNSKHKFCLDRVKIVEPIGEALEPYVGVIPSEEFPSALNILANLKSQSEWFDELDFLPFDGSPFTTQGGEVKKLFDVKKQTMQPANPRNMEIARQGIYVLIKNESYSSTFTLLKKNSSGEWIGTSLSNLEDKRRARILVNEFNGVIPMRWNRENHTLTLPQYLHLPPRVMRAVCISSMKLPASSKSEFYDGFQIDSHVYEGIDERIMGQISRVLWHGGDLDD